MVKSKGTLEGVITHKQSTSHFHVKSFGHQCYHCKIRPIFRKRPKFYFFKPGDVVAFTPLEGFKRHGIIEKKLNADNFVLENVYNQDHQCDLVEHEF